MFAMLQLSSHITKNQKHFLLTPQIPPRYGVSPKTKKATPGWPGIAAGLSNDGGVGGERGGDRGQYRDQHLQDFRPNRFVLLFHSYLILKLVCVICE